MKPAKKAKGTPLSRTVNRTQKSAVKKAKDKPLSRTVKRTPKKVKLTPLSKFISQWDKEQGPVPTLYDTATKLDEVVNTLTDIQHLMDCSLDDCVDLTDNARAISLLHLAYGMVKGVIDKTDSVTSDLYRINRKSLG